MRVLYVCTANICRSASAAHLLRAAVAEHPELAGVEVRSAGTDAVAGMPGCAVAPALVGVSRQHRSQALTRELIQWADLILPAARDHRAAVVAWAPEARTRTFTIRQMDRIGRWLVDSGMVQAARERAAGSGTEDWADGFDPGDPRRAVEPMPEDAAARLAWLVSELDAARGMAGVAPESGSAPVREPARRWRLRRGLPTGAGQPGRGQQPGGDAPDQPARHPGSATGPGPGDGVRAGPSPKVDPSELHPDDIPDPHVLGMGLHAVAYEQLRSSTDALLGLLREVSPA